LPLCQQPFALIQEMLFKFASYLLGTNTEQEDPQSAVPPTSGPPLSNHPDDCNRSTSYASRPQSIDADNTNADGQLASNHSAAESAAELIYDERFVQTDDRPERLEDSLHEDDEQWIYITPIRVQPLKPDPQEEEEDLDAATENADADQFNMFELFNANRNRTTIGTRNKLEESWVIHPPACFQVDNTFAIEQHPLENLYIEQPVLSVISAKRAAAAAVAKATSGVDNKENSVPKASSMRSSARRNPRKNGRTRSKASKKDGASNSNDSNGVQGNNNNTINSNNASINMNALAAMATGTTTTSGFAAAGFTSGSRRSSGRFARVSPNLHPAISGETLLAPSLAFRRENILARPFTIHRKLC
jgi:hypothetical protein